MTELESHPRADQALQIGAVASNFELPDERGQMHSLAQGLGAGKPVVLIFMRGEW